MEIREVKQEELEALLTLYTHLHNNPMPEIDTALYVLWGKMIADQNHHILVGIVDGSIVSSCVLVIVPNLTHAQRPYALIENVVTHLNHRNKGYATAILHAASQMAAAENCYKIMLMTGSKEEKTLKFYERAGFNQTDKTAFIQWL